MDILSVRKKKKAAEAEAAAKAAPSPSPSPKSPAKVSPPASAKPPPTSETTTSAPPEASTPLNEDRSARGAVSTPNPKAVHNSGPVDPLEGFLARYDDDQSLVDFGAVRASNIDDAERYLSFVLAGEDYAASIMDVREILTIRSLTDVPRAPRGVLGVISKRGLVLPVIDVATILGLRQPDRRLRVSQRVLVVGEGDRACGMRVDAVAEVIKLKANQIEGVPPSIGVKNAGLLVGLGRIESKLYILLDVPAVLDAFASSLGLAPLRAEVR